jgi:hypothetical protein
MKLLQQIFEEIREEFGKAVDRRIDKKLEQKQQPFQIAADVEKELSLLREFKRQVKESFAHRQRTLERAGVNHANVVFAVDVENMLKAFEPFTKQ